MSPYSKPYLALPDQIALLQGRGLEISDPLAAEDCLRRIGYYRLSAYWYPFRQVVAIHPAARSDVFLPGSRLQDAVAIYVFDKKLKMLLLDAIERVEIAIRVEIALLLGARDPLAHLNPRWLHPNFCTRPGRSGNTPFAEWQIKFAGMVARSGDDFVRHYQANYSTPLPIWMAIELWDFGLLSWFFKGMRVGDQTAIANRYGIADRRILESWLRALNFVRNVIAHHGRLWNRNLVDYPRLPVRGDIPAFDALLTVPNVDKRIYSVCCILAHFLEQINPSSSWATRLGGLLDGFPHAPYLRIGDMGFPSNWKTHAFWN